MDLSKAQKSILYILLIALFFQSQTNDLQADVIKFATILPEGAPGMGEIHKTFKQLEKKSNGEIVIKIGAGGIAGDEIEVLNKMKLNRLQMGVFSLMGLVKILPEIVILSHLGLYQNAEEAEYIREVLYNKLYEDFYWEGFVLLCLIDAGPIYLYSSIDLSNTNNITQLKLWAYRGDELFIDIFQEMGIQVISLDASDVLTGFETEIINTVYGPPFAVPAFQVMPKIRFMLDYPFAYLPSAFLITVTAFEKLSKENQEILKNYVRMECGNHITTVRKMNSDAMEILQESGVKVVKPTDKHNSLINKSINLFTNNILSRNLYSERMFKEVQRILVEFRKLKTKNK